MTVNMATQVMCAWRRWHGRRFQVPGHIYENGHARRKKSRMLSDMSAGPGDIGVTGRAVAKRKALRRSSGKNGQLFVPLGRWMRIGKVEDGL